MLYCTYAQYQAAGGALDEAAFGPLCLGTKLGPAYLWPG